jgi:hypothetical protein
MNGVTKRGKQKRFSQKLFDQNDSLARAAITKYISETMGLIVEPNPNKYGVDLYVFDKSSDDPKYSVECEIKRVWNGPKLPWTTVQLPYRKLKYAEQEASPVEYWILNSQLTHAIVIYEKELLDNRLVHVRNKYVSEGEYFYQVPLDHCSIVQLV